MKTTLRSLLPAAAAAAALLAAPSARADHVERWPAPPPAYAPAPLAYRPEPDLARGAAWAQLRHEVRALERARQRFYATWHGNPWRQRRFETWYASRRAELDQRREWLAWGEWRRGGERYAWQGHEGHRDD